MAEYVVKWEIDIEADTPLEAALEADRIMRAGSSFGGWTFMAIPRAVLDSIKRDDGRAWTMIDLAEEQTGKGDGDGRTGS